MREFNLAEQIRRGNRQTVLIVPEWQVSPAASNTNQGRFAQQGFFTEMLKEALGKVPDLAQGGLRNVQNIHIFSHSAGYAPTASILNRNPELASRIQSVTMLDSLYSPNAVAPWIQANAQDLSTGRRRFVNIYNSSTEGHSRNQQAQLRQMMARLGRPDAVQNANSAGDISRSNAGIIFRRTSSSHARIPNDYIANSLQPQDAT